MMHDYHLWIGQLSKDTRRLEGHALLEQRLDEAQTGTAMTVTLIDAPRPEAWRNNASCIYASP